MVEKVWHCVLAPLGTVLEYGFGRQVTRQGEDEQSRRLNKHSSFLNRMPFASSVSRPLRACEHLRILMP